jgi:hypothetical protein
VCRESSELAKGGETSGLSLEGINQAFGLSNEQTNARDWRRGITKTETGGHRWRRADQRNHMGDYLSSIPELSLDRPTE